LLNTTNNSQNLTLTFKRKRMSHQHGTNGYT